MFFKLLAKIFVVIVSLELFYLSFSLEQESSQITFPSPKENQTIQEHQQRQKIQQQEEQQQKISSPMVIEAKRIDWWPPATPAFDQEAAQHQSSSSFYQYSPWIQQASIPSSYYPHVSLGGPLGQVRSEHHPYPSEITEYNHPIIAQGFGNSLGLSPKHFAIVSFIGLLLLFAIIQNSLMSSKRKDALVEALSGRRKRDLYFAHGLRPMTPEQEEILNEDARLRCIQRTICLENRKLTANFGSGGTKLAKHLTNSIRKSIKSSPGWDRLVADAGAAGLRNENCEVLYRDCDLPILSISSLSQQQKKAMRN